MFGGDCFWRFPGAWWTETAFGKSRPLGANHFKPLWILLPSAVKLGYVPWFQAMRGPHVCVKSACVQRWVCMAAVSDGHH